MEMNSTLNRSAIAPEEETNYSTGFHETYDIVPILLIVLIVTSNTLVLFLFYRKRTLRTASNILLSSLALSDNLTGLCGIPLYLVCSGTYQGSVCKSSVMFTRFTSISTVLHLTVVTIDRLAGVMKPLQYSTIIRKSRAYNMVIFSWIISIFCSLVQLDWLISTNVTSDGDKETIKKENTYIIFCLVAFYILPLSLMLFSYTFIFVEVLRQRRKISKLNMSSYQKTIRQNKLASEWKPALLFTSMTIIFMITWFSYFFLNIQHNLEPIPLPIWGEYIVIYLRFLTSFSNPLLYVFGKKDFREEIAKMWCAHNMERGGRTLSTDGELHHNLGNTVV